MKLFIIPLFFLVIATSVVQLKYLGIRDFLILLCCLFFILCLCLVKHLNGSDPLINRIKQDVSKLDHRISNIAFYSSTESYTEDKDKIFLCLKDDEKGEYYDYNTLIYVAIHECAHALTDVIDLEHVTPEYRNMFKYLLDKATSIGIYDPSKPLPNHYCKIKINPDTIQR